MTAAKRMVGLALDGRRTLVARLFMDVAVIVLSWGCVNACAIASERSAPVRVNGGSFLMGTAKSGPAELRTRYGLDFPGAFEEEVEAHQVTLGDFRMDRHEVTNARFADFVAAHPEWGPGRRPAGLHNGHYLDDWKSGSYPDGRGEHPVVFVTWHAAQAYCRWAGGRLPTEAEWEYAARARDEREFPWGDELPSPARANYSASNIGTTTPAGSYLPNPLGLHDMAGNVWEWLLDAWRPSYSSAAAVDPIAGGSVSDDALESVRGRRGVRGGSYDGGDVNLRTRWRDSHEVNNATSFVGFRCVYPVDQKER